MTIDWEATTVALVVEDVTEPGIRPVAWPPRPVSVEGVAQVSCPAATRRCTLVS